ncbi:hypothetical protein CY34DRAFT_809082, partial [Suillus luteus UH-Slu-Lm8-n1]
MLYILALCTFVQSPYLPSCGKTTLMNSKDAPRLNGNLHILLNNSTVQPTTQSIFDPCRVVNFHCPHYHSWPLEGPGG